jgi:hypothetical protein
MQEFEVSIVAAVARARTDPTGLAARVEARLQYFKGKEYFPPGRGGAVAVPTREGAAAVREAIEFLRAQPALAPVVPPADGVAARALHLAAEDHVADRGTLGAVGHDGADGSSAQERLGRYGAWREACGECLWFGTTLTDADELVADLGASSIYRLSQQAPHRTSSCAIPPCSCMPARPHACPQCPCLHALDSAVVDDGVPQRGHRTCIFDERFAVAVAAMGKHATFGTMVAIEFASRYEGDAARVAAREAGGPPRLSASARALTKVGTQWRLGGCAGCGAQIRGGAVVDVQPLGKFHKECYKCAACAKALVGVQSRPEGGRPYCADCHTAKFAPECAGCGQKIPPGTAYVKSGGKSYHKNCSPAASAKAGGRAATGSSAKPSPKPAGARTAKPALGAAPKPKVSMGGSRAAMEGLMSEMKDLEM